MPHRVFVLDFSAHFRQIISALRAAKKKVKRPVAMVQNVLL